MSELERLDKERVDIAASLMRRGSVANAALLQAICEALREQDARIAALEAARAPHGLPLEGTGPLPLERT